MSGATEATPRYSFPFLFQPGLCECGCGTETAHRLASGHRRRQPFRFRIDGSTGCWLWRGSTSHWGGYAYAKLMGQTAYMHVLFYEALHGPIPQGLQLDHVIARGCQGPPCVNPAHMEPVTIAENTRRGRKAKITMEMARAIRAAEGSQREIAKRFPVAKSQIANIRSGRCWSEPACWQCGHPEEAHTVEDRGCTDSSCSCAQVPEQ